MEIAKTHGCASLVGTSTRVSASMSVRASVGARVIAVEIRLSVKIKDQILKS